MASLAATCEKTRARRLSVDVAAAAPHLRLVRRGRRLLAQVVAGGALAGGGAFPLAGRTFAFSSLLVSVSEPSDVIRLENIVSL